jgi:hypothetical protein
MSASTRKRQERICPRRSLGAPDIICCIKGRFIRFEVKTPLGRQSDHQEAYQRKLMDAGGIHFFVRSLDHAVVGIEVKSPASSIRTPRSRMVIRRSPKMPT